MHDVVPRRICTDDGQARALADTRLRESMGQASHRVGGLPDGPLLARHRIHERESIRVPARSRQERPRGRIVGGHEAAAAFAAAMAA